MKKHLFLAFLLLVSLCVHAQSNSKKIKGRILDKENREALIGVSVVLQNNPSTGTVTDLDGNFEISIPNNQSQLSINYVGYKPLVVAAKDGMVIELETDALGLEEIVVVGYGTMKKSDLTGSVSSVKGSDLNVLSTPNVAAALTGRASGVQVVSSGSVDGSTKVRIRGVGTINNSDPLYVVDGFPTSDISYIAPSDIESMEVLKDASASAIYGSRGANGVIMITTKKGANQAAKISVNTYWGARKISKYLDVLNAEEYAKARIEAYENDNLLSSMDPIERSILDYSINNHKKGTEWQKEILRTAIVQDYNISVVGGSQDVKYNLSTTYNSEEGILKNSFVDKLFIKLNTEYKIRKNVTVGTDLAFVNYDMSNTDLGNMYGSALLLAGRAAPVSPVYTQSGNWEDTMTLDSNPVRLNEMEKYKKRHGNKFVGNFFLNVDLMKGLSFRSTFGGDYTFKKHGDYMPVYFVSQQERNTLSSLKEDRESIFSWVWSNVATYNFDFGKEHRLTAMAGTEATYNQYEAIAATAFDVQENEDMRYISAAKSKDYIANSRQGKSSIFSTMFRVNYGFRNKYLLTATVRTDSSSRFAKKNRTGTFPSLSLGWNAKEESFLSDLAALSQLKVRAGWGQVGNQSSVGLGAYQSKITNGEKYVFGGVVHEGRIPTELSNDNLKWERAEQYNVGLDMAFFDAKLRANIDYFVKDTKDMIVKEPVPNFVGAKPPYNNVGSMRNNGFEFTLNYNNKLGDVNYNVGMNMSFIKNEVTNLGTAGAFYGTVYDQRLINTSKTEVGREIAYYYGLKTDGIFNTQEELDAYVHTDESGTKQPIQKDAKVGDVKYTDRNADGQIDEKDMEYLGSYIPDFTGGFNLGLDYKGVFFSLFADFVSGNKIANMPLYDLQSSKMDKNILKSYYNNRWTKENPNANQPRLTTSKSYEENSRFSDRYIEDGSFLRIRNIQLGYAFPKHMLSKIKLDQARIYVSVDNLVTFTKYSGYNPEVSDQWDNPLVAGSDVGSAPMSRTITLGLNLTF